MLMLQVNPNIRRDKWTEEEDAKLIELVKTFGVGRWAEIARNCDGRTDQQCMGRWRRHLDPSIRRVSTSLPLLRLLLHALYLSPVT
jgi:myb proto-oncogene protein